MRVVIFALLVLQGSALSLRKPPNAVLRLRGGGKPGKLKDNALYRHIVSPDSPVVSLLTTQAKQAAEDKLNYEENSPLVGVITLDGARYCNDDIYTVGEKIDTSDDGLETAFKSLDSDSSGKISMQEMTAYIASVYTVYAGSNVELDESIIKKMLAVADRSNVGEVDLKEFKTIMREGPAPKKWAVGDTDNRNSYWKLKYRCLFSRAEGLTFEVVQAGLKDDGTFASPGVVTYSDVTFASPDDGVDTYTDKFIDSHSKLGGKATFRIANKKATATETQYTYSSEEIYKGLENAVKALLVRKVSVIVGDCGFDNGIQGIVAEIIAKNTPTSSPSTPCLMSTLTLLPTMLKMTTKKDVVLVLTSNGASFENMFKKLTDDAPKDKVEVLGLQEVVGFGPEVANGTSVDLETAVENILKAIEVAIKKVADKGRKVSCILCECSELPAYSNQIRKKFRLPVFDAMTCASLVADSVKPYAAFSLKPVAEDGRNSK